MKIRKILSLLLLVFATTAYAQKNFQFTPEKPKAGEVISFTYEPAGDIANTTLPVEAVAYIKGTHGKEAKELVLTRQGKKLIGNIPTDTSQHFLYLAFTSGEQIDNNYNEGYWIQLYDGPKLKKGANIELVDFYSYNDVGVEKNSEKALKFLEQEITLYPESRKQYLLIYINLMTTLKKAEKSALIQNEIEALLKNGLKTEEDYNLMESLYNQATLPEQAKQISSIKKEKYPSGKWVVTEMQRKFFAERDPLKKEQLLVAIIQKTEKEENWKDQKANLERYWSQIPYAYLSKNDWDGMKNAVDRAGLNEDVIAVIYNSAAWKIAQSSNKDTLKKYGEPFAKLATTRAKSEWLKPTAEKHISLTQKQWNKSRADAYATYADTYASILYKLGEYQKGVAYAKDAAIIINKGKDPKLNSNYALLAEKALPAKKYKKDLKQFVKEAKGTDSIYAILKRIYTKEKKSDTGFDDYIVALQKENYSKLLAELHKSMISETAPLFAVLDLNGNKVDLATMKGKVVVLDFWATWCGPCIGSFPAMQKMVAKYKKNPDVKFFFVDTYERVEDKKKKVSDFIAEKKYDFQVLMDEENKVAEQFKVTSIPHKFVIDKEGIIRFKAIGFDGGDDGLINELSAMIEIAGGG